METRPNYFKTDQSKIKMHKQKFKNPLKEIHEEILENIDKALPKIKDYGEGSQNYFSSTKMR